VFEVPIAVIVVIPCPLASANPAELMVETSTSLDCQETVFVMSTVTGAVVYVPTAINWLGSPTLVTDCELGMTVIEVRS
jgi:hypothetical protein